MRVMAGLTLVYCCLNQGAMAGDVATPPSATATIDNHQTDDFGMANPGSIAEPGRARSIMRWTTRVPWTCIIVYS